MNIKKKAAQRIPKINLEDLDSGRVVAETAKKPVKKNSAPVQSEENEFDDSDYSDPLDHTDDSAGDELAPLSMYDQNQLPHIKPRAGYTQRWVRYSNREGRTEVGNIRKMQAKGWQPRRGNTIPKMYNLDPEKDPRLGDIIVVQGHVLCEMPMKRAQVIRKYLGDKARRNEISVKSDLLNEADQKRFAGLGVNPSFENEKTVALGKKRSISVAPDDDNE